MLNLNCSLLKPMLVLEDDPVHQLRIAKILEKIGYMENDIFFAQTIAFAKNICQSNSVEFMLVDLSLPDGNGIDFIQNIRDERASKIPIMVLSSWNTLEVIYQALHVGATGYVLKEKDDFELMFSIQAILKGGAIIDPFIAKKILREFKKQDMEDQIFEINKLSPLSSREAEVLSCVAAGMSNLEIATDLCISKFTVQVHIKNIYQKLEVNSRMKAVQAAKKMRVLQ